MIVVRILLIIGIFPVLMFGAVYIKGAFKQIVPIKEVYVRPPHDCCRRRGILWRLLKFPYVMVDSGYQFLLSI